MLLTTTGCRRSLDCFSLYVWHQTEDRHCSPFRGRALTSSLPRAFMRRSPQQLQQSPSNPWRHARKHPSSNISGDWPTQCQLRLRSGSCSPTTMTFGASGDTPFMHEKQRAPRRWSTRFCVVARQPCSQLQRVMMSPAMPTACVRCWVGDWHASLIATSRMALMSRSTTWQSTLTWPCASQCCCRFLGVCRGASRATGCAIWRFASASTRCVVSPRPSLPVRNQSVLTRSSYRVCDGTVAGYHGICRWHDTLHAH